MKHGVLFRGMGRSALAGALLLAAVLAPVLAGCATSSATYASIDEGCRVAGRDMAKKLNSSLPLAFVSLRTSELENYITDEITDILVRTGRFQIYDRRQLEALAQERNFQFSGDVSDDQQRALGRMAGAQVVLSTRITNLQGAVRFSIRAIDIESGQIVAASPAITVQEDPAIRLINQVPGGGPTATTTPAQTPVNPPSPAPMRGSPQVTVRNNSGQTVFYLKISPVSADTWGDDWLGSSETIPDGAAKTVTLHSGEAHDFRLTTSDGRNMDRRNVTVSNGMTLTFTASDLPAGGPALTIRNSTGATIYYLRISPVDNDTWGDDWLGSNVIMNGDSHTVNLRMPLSTQNHYDIRVTDSDGNHYDRRNVTVSAGMTVTFTAADRQNSGSSTMAPTPRAESITALKERLLAG